MTLFKKARRPIGKATLYATSEDFRHSFLDDMDSLYQLSLLLMADHEKAEQCFLASFEDSLESKSVFRDCVRSWARRAVIKNAIRILQPQAWQSDSSSAPAVLQSDTEIDDAAQSRLDSLLALGDFQRFAFVMSVLEHYSDQECAVLLACSRIDVRDARIRALEQLGHSSSKAPSGVSATPSRVDASATA